MATTRGSPSAAGSASAVVSVVPSHPANAAPAISWTNVDAYLVYQFGYKTGEHGTQTQANILCYLQNQLVGYINFYPSDAVPESTIGVPNSTATTLLVLNFPLERFAEVIQTIRVEKGITIRVDTAQKLAMVGSGVAPTGHV